MTLIHLFPETVRRELIERLQLGIIYGHEHLISRRVEVELESCLKKGLLDLCRVTDSVLSNVLIETAAEKLIMHDAALFTALFEANPYSHEAVRNYRSLLNIAAGGDVDLLVRRAETWWTAKTEEKDKP